MFDTHILILMYGHTDMWYQYGCTLYYFMYIMFISLFKHENKLNAFKRQFKSFFNVSAENHRESH